MNTRHWGPQPGAGPSARIAAEIAAATGRATSLPVGRSDPRSGYRSCWRRTWGLDCRRERSADTRAVPVRRFRERPRGRVHPGAATRLHVHGHPHAAVPARAALARHGQADFVKTARNPSRQAGHAHDGRRSPSWRSFSGLAAFFRRLRCLDIFRRSSYSRWSAPLARSTTT